MGRMKTAGRFINMHRSKDLAIERGEVPGPLVCMSPGCPRIGLNALNIFL
jgi:hypothetical protein